MSRTPDASTGVESTNATPGKGRGSNPQSLDDVFDVLSADRRRHVLYVLYCRPGPVTLRDLADATTPESGTDVERVTAELAHVHLPKLDDAGVVEYDRDDGSASLTDLSARFERYLAAAAADEGKSLRRSSASATLSEF